MYSRGGSAGGGNGNNQRSNRGTNNTGAGRGRRQGGRGNGRGGGRGRGRGNGGRGGQRRNHGHSGRSHGSGGRNQSNHNDASRTTPRMGGPGNNSNTAMNRASPLRGRGHPLSILEASANNIDIESSPPTINYQAPEVHNNNPSALSLGLELPFGRPSREASYVDEWANSVASATTNHNSNSSNNRNNTNPRPDTPNLPYTNDRISIDSFSEGSISSGMSPSSLPDFMGYPAVDENPPPRRTSAVMAQRTTAAASNADRSLPLSRLSMDDFPTAPPMRWNSETNNTRTNNRFGDEPTAPGLQRIMHRLFLQTLGMNAGTEEDDTLDLFGLFDDAFDVNPTMDVRRSDQLVCPTCMRVHLPVEGSEQIVMPNEERVDGNAGNAGAAEAGGEEVGGARADRNVSDRDSANLPLPPVASSVNETTTQRQNSHSSTIGESAATNNNPLFPRLEQELQNYIRTARVARENDDHGRDDVSDGTSAGLESMPPLSSDVSDVEDGDAPLPPPETSASFSASNLTRSNIDARGRTGNNNASLGISDLTGASRTQQRNPSTPLGMADLISNLMHEAILDYNDRFDDEDESDVSSSSGGSSMPSLESVERVEGNAEAMEDANDHVPSSDLPANPPAVSNGNEEASYDSSMPPLENDEVLSEEESEVSSHGGTAFVRSTEAIIGNDASLGCEEESDFPSLGVEEEVFDGEVSEVSDLVRFEEPLPENEDGERGQSQEVGVKGNDEVQQEEELGESSHGTDSSMPPLEDEESDSGVHANAPATADETTNSRQQNNGPTEGRQLVREGSRRLSFDDMAGDALDLSDERLGEFREFVASTEDGTGESSNTGARPNRFVQFRDFMEANINNLSNANAPFAVQRRADEENEALREAQQESARFEVPVILDRPSGDVDDEALSDGSSSSAEPSSLPALIRRSDLSSASTNSFLSVQGDIDNDAPDSSMPLLFPNTSLGSAESRLVRFRRMLAERSGGNNNDGGGGRRHDRALRNEDRTPTNPLTHLRDYGALRVFATATCPICLEECNPIVALQCGHAMCEDDFIRLGGYLASDKEKLKAAAESAGASSTNALVPNNVSEAAGARQERARFLFNDTTQERVRSLFEQVTSSMPPSVPPNRSVNRSMPNTQTIPTSVTIGSPISNHPQRRGSRTRGNVWSWGITRHCENPDCYLNGTLHRSLYSVSEANNGLSYESCYRLGSKIVADGRGGLWIQEACGGDNPNWPVLHKNRRREVEKYEIPRDAEMVSDGNGGVWAMSSGGYSDVLEIQRFLPNLTQDVATVPRQSMIFYGPGGKVWVHVQRSTEDYQMSIEEPLEEGLTLVGSRSKRFIGTTSNRISFSEGEVDSDGFGNLWFLEENDVMEALVLKRILANGDYEETGFEFPLGGSEVYGCGSSSGVFVFHQSPECDDFEGQLSYISHDERTNQWSSAVVGECPTDTKFASDGNGKLWALMVDDDDECMYWKCNNIGMDPIHEWGLSFASTDLIGG